LFKASNWLFLALRIVKVIPAPIVIMRAIPMARINLTLRELV